MHLVRTTQRAGMFSLSARATSASAGQATLDSIVKLVSYYPLKTILFCVVITIRYWLSIQFNSIKFNFYWSLTYLLT